MKSLSCWLRRQTAGVLVVLLGAPFGEAAAARPQPELCGQQSQSSSAPQEQAQAGSSAVNTSKQAGTYPDSPTPASTQIADESAQSGTPQSGQQNQQNDVQKPVGTAAAPYEKTIGVAASRPAGAVIAPAKQRRARAIWISIAVVAGVGIAIGTVVGLSRASPSQPPH